VKVSAKTFGKLISRDFEALRFGVQQKDTVGPRVVGPADRQSPMSSSLGFLNLQRAQRAPDRAGC